MKPLGTTWELHGQRLGTTWDNLENTIETTTNAKDIKYTKQNAK